MRNFAPTRQRKHKGRDNKSASSHETLQDSNVTEVISLSTTAKNEKKRKLAEELRNEGPKVSGKKAKRLEKYIENKLKKDENRELIEKLARSKTDTSLFQSSSRLGQGKETKRQTIRRALREKQRDIDIDGDNDEILFAKAKQRPQELPGVIDPEPSDASEESDADSEDEVTSPDDSGKIHKTVCTQ